MEKEKKARQTAQENAAAKAAADAEAAAIAAVSYWLLNRFCIQSANRRLIFTLNILIFLFCFQTDWAQAKEIAEKEAAQIAKRREFDAKAAEIARQKAKEMEDKLAALAKKNKDAADLRGETNFPISWTW